MMHQRFICPVGQGGFAVERIGDFTAVYDCGTKSSYQMVDNCISCLAHNVTRVDVLFISHFDKDHVNSIKKLLERVKVIRAVMPLIPDALKIAYGAYTKGGYTSIRTLLNEYRVEVDEVGDDARMETDGLGYLWEWIAKSMMSQNEFDKVLSYLQSEKVDVSRLSKDTYYLDNQKEIINNAFIFLFGCNGPNSKGLVVLSQKCRRTVTNKTVVYVGHEWSKKNHSSLEFKESSCLYVGDAYLRNISNRRLIEELLSRYRTESPLLLMQIPHHGSRYNVGVQFENDFEARLYFVNDINMNRIEKNERLYNSLTSQKKLLLSGDKCNNLIVTKTEIV